MVRKLPPWTSTARFWPPPSNPSRYVGRDGTATQDAIEWEAGLRSAIALVTEDVSREELYAIGITGQWASTVPVGPDDAPAGPVMLWSDTARGTTSANSSAGRSRSEDTPAQSAALAADHRRRPNPSGADPTGHSLLLQNELSDVGERCRVLLEPVDYVAFLLTGRAAATPASMTASLADRQPHRIRAGVRRRLVRRSGRKRHLLPELIPTGSIQGDLLPGPAERLGLKAGVPVACGIP